MPSDKYRLYVALYIRGREPIMAGGEDAYYWALIVGPKNEPDEGGRGVCFRVMEEMAPLSWLLHVPVWTYDEMYISLQPNQMLLVRVVIGKVIDGRRLRDIFSRIPIRDSTPDWDCVGWVKEAPETTFEDGKALGTSANDWNSVRETAMWYVGHKREAHRFDGQGEYDMTKVPTWDMLKGRELTR
ncbi:hypothetical protein F4801DRAFT_569015 [Xylaria longipes]|nr:hypothetical protein F4801DRAFT_569015 [Xylaria longipes]